MESSQISDLASEILLFIFLHLDLYQLVVCRRVNKQSQEVIDNNQLLWRRFEWIQQDQESFRPVLDMFDRKSRSSLEKVTIQEKNSEEADLLHLISVLKRSKETLIEICVKASESEEIKSQIVELMTAGSKLRSLVVWEWDSERYTESFPLSRLEPSSSKVQILSSGQLQLLWVWNDGVANVDSKHLNSLVSFAQASAIKDRDCRELIKNFSESIVHLRLGIDQGSSRAQPLFCPNSKIFEGWATEGVSSFFDAPQLQILILESMIPYEMKGFPLSVEEIWLRSRNYDLDLAEDWEPLLRQCPKLRMLKLTEQFVTGSSKSSFDLTAILTMLETRKVMASDGKEINGIKIISLQKLILPTGTLNDEQLERAADTAEELIDVKGYKEFIDIEF